MSTETMDTLSALPRTLDDAHADAVEAIAKVTAAADALGQAKNVESQLEDERALVKQAATKRLMEAGTASSATAAEKIVETDGGYALHRQQQRQAVLATQQAWGAYEAAKLRAELAVAVVRAVAGGVA